MFLTGLSFGADADRTLVAIAQSHINPAMFVADAVQSGGSTKDQGMRIKAGQKIRVLIRVSIQSGPSEISKVRHDRSFMIGPLMNAVP